MSKYAPRRNDGLMAYVVTTHSWGRATDRIEWAESLNRAKGKYGWTRRLHTTMSVRRATPDDLVPTPAQPRPTRPVVDDAGGK